MKLSEVIRALHHRTEEEYTQAQRRAAKTVAIGVLKRHLRWNDDCRPVVPSTAQEAFDKNAQFALSMRIVTKCFSASVVMWCDNYLRLPEIRECLRKAITFPQNTHRG